MAKEQEHRKRVKKVLKDTSLCATHGGKCPTEDLFVIEWETSTGAYVVYPICKQCLNRADAGDWLQDLMRKSLEGKSSKD